MPRTVLKNLGLTDNEIKIYLTSLALNHAPVSIIAKKCGIKRTSAHTIIEKLAKKGFLTSFNKKNIKYFSAIDPEIIVDKCKENAQNANNMLKRIEYILPVLANLKSTYQNKTKLKFFEGFDGIKGLFNDALHDNEVIKAIMQVEDFSEELLKFLENEYFPKRSLNKAKLGKSIFLSNKKDNDYLHKLKNILGESEGDIKKISLQKLSLNVSFQLYSNKVAIYSTGKDDLGGILIENEKIYNTFLAIFDFIWDSI